MQAATAPLRAEVPGYMQTCFYLMCKSNKSMGYKKMTFFTQTEGAKGARWALAQIHWITLLEKRICKFLSP